MNFSTLVQLFEIYEKRGNRYMLEKIPNNSEMTALVSQPLYDVWTKLCTMIEEKYDIECLWNNGGKAWMYEYKYCRGSKTLCALYARENCIGFMIIFGKNEREKFEADRLNYSESVQRIYDEAPTYHDGKWIMFEPTDSSLFDDLIRLLGIKRKPNRKSSGKTVSIIDQVDLLLNKNNNIAYNAMKELQQESEQSNALYFCIDKFIDMIDNKNSYVRIRGLVLIASNAKWDIDFKIDEIIDKYLQHITDVKPITARQCIKMLPTIAKFKSDLRQDIIVALQKADISFYADSMRSLIDKDIQEALKRIEIG